MEPVIVAVLVGIIVYCVIVALIPKRILADTTKYTRNMLQQLERENVPTPDSDHASIFREQLQKAGPIARVFYSLPGVKMSYPSLLKAGITNSVEKFFITCLIVLLLALFVLKKFGLIGIILSIVITYVFAWRIVKRRIRKRNETFLNLFPDALDMIVRSVRSGYPLNAAIRMVAENMQPPVSTEFRQVADEVAYGSTLLDALQRLSYRIDEPDVRFFVVMLAVQQEVGGNLSEVLSNLASIIRKRRHLRMKIKAMTSEGRATAWVLGALPVMEFAAIYYVAPKHLEPLFNTTLGNMILGGAIGIVLLGMFIVQKMVDMEV